MTRRKHFITGTVVGLRGASAPSTMWALGVELPSGLTARALKTCLRGVGGVGRNLKWERERERAVILVCKTSVRLFFLIVLLTEK